MFKATGCSVAVLSALLRWCSSADGVEPSLLVSGGITFEERLIWGEGHYVWGIGATDIDHDGDLDFSAAGVFSDTFVWFQNDGHNNLRQLTICEREPGYLERHAFGDLNGDGLRDAVIVKNRTGEILWYENSGTPGDGRLWKRHTLTADFKRAYDVDLADLDNDGDLDVAGSAYTGNCFSWFENPGAETVNEPWSQHRFDEGPQLENTRTIVFTDFNRDGYPDLLATATYSGRTLWYRNTGEADPRFVAQEIDSEMHMPVHGRPVDMEGDGDFDVVMAFGIRGALSDPLSHQAAWYENVGSPGPGTEWKRHSIGHVPYGTEATAGDLDGDGDIDVIASGCSGGTDRSQGEICWFENSGDPQGEWTRHLLRNYPRAGPVMVVDFDRDGRLDIAATSEAGSAYWWRNLGQDAVDRATVRQSSP
jgi:hypothetical protein